MILWLLQIVWALECNIDPLLIETGTIEGGFSPIFYEAEEGFIQEAPHWNDQIVRMSLLFEKAPEEPFFIRWTSQLQGVLYEAESTQYTQLWAPHLRAGIHQISAHVQTASGDSCTSSITLRVEIPPLSCGFVSEEKIDVFFVEDVGQKSALIDSTYQHENPFPQDRIFYVVVNKRSQETVEVWIQEDTTKKQYPVSLKRRFAQIHLPPKDGEHSLSLTVASKIGRRCTSTLRFVSPIEKEEAKYSFPIDQSYEYVPDLMAGSGIGLTYHSGWGGESVFTPSFDMVLAARVNDAGYLLGGDFKIDFREAYRKYVLKAKAGFLNGFVLGPVVLLSGGGLGYDEMKELNPEFSENFLSDISYFFGYWRSDIFWWITPRIALSGGFIPRWHWNDQISTPEFWDSYSWHTSIRVAVWSFTYQQHVVFDKTIHSVGISLGWNLLE